MNSWDSSFVLHNAVTPPVPPLIGPVLPDGAINGFIVQEPELPPGNGEVQTIEAESSTHLQQRFSRERGHGGPSRDRSDHSRERRRLSRSRDYNRQENNDRRNYFRRDRASIWENNKERPGQARGSMPVLPVGNMMMPGNIMGFNNVYNQPHSLMEQQQLDVHGHNIISGLNIMPNVLDQKMTLTNQHLIPLVPPSHQISLSSGSLLPPIPGRSVPPRREYPKGCRTLIIGGLPSSVKSDVVIEIFQRFGEITEVKIPRQGIFHVRFTSRQAVESAFSLSGYRFKFHDQIEAEATIMNIEYALNRDDESEYGKRKRGKTPPRVEPFTQTVLSSILEKIKNELEFVNFAPTLTGWLERGECNKKNANNFYSLIQASNNQLRRLFNEKMLLDEEFQNFKSTIRDRFAHVLMQFQQVAKILSAARHQRVFDHFTKQQRRNIVMWLKMTEEVENIKEEFNNNFEDDDGDKINSSKLMVAQEKYDKLKTEYENLTYELEGYKNEAYLAKNEAEVKFEKFKAHFITQQALQNKQIHPRSSFLTEQTESPTIKSNPPASTSQDDRIGVSSLTVQPSEAKLISILTAFLMVHPLGASLDYLVSYVRSMTPNVKQAFIHQTLQKYSDVFRCKTTGVGATIEHKWTFITFDLIKSEN